MICNLYIYIKKDSQFVQNRAALVDLLFISLLQIINTKTSLIS